MSSHHIRLEHRKSINPEFIYGWRVDKKESVSFILQSGFERFCPVFPILIFVFAPFLLIVFVAVNRSPSFAKEKSKCLLLLTQ